MSTWRFDLRPTKMALCCVFILTSLWVTFLLWQLLLEPLNIWQSWGEAQDPRRTPIVNIGVRSCLCFSRKLTKTQMAPDSMHSPKTCIEHWTKETSEGKWQIHPKETSQEGEWTVNSERHQIFPLIKLRLSGNKDTVLPTPKWCCCVYWLITW